MLEDTSYRSLRQIVQPGFSNCNRAAVARYYWSYCRPGNVKSLFKNTRLDVCLLAGVIEFKLRSREPVFPERRKKSSNSSTVAITVPDDSRAPPRISHNSARTPATSGTRIRQINLKTAAEIQAPLCKGNFRGNALHSSDRVFPGCRYIVGGRALPACNLGATLSGPESHVPESCSRHVQILFVFFRYRRQQQNQETSAARLRSRYPRSRIGTRHVSVVVRRMV